MKKIIAGLLCLLTLGTYVFAQNSEGRIGTPDAPYTPEEFEELKLKTQTITYTTDEVRKIVFNGSSHKGEMDQFDDTCTIKIEYMPIYDEVRIYYECLYVTYDQGQAMNVVLAMLQDFQKEHKYYGYRYLKDDKDKFFKDDKGRRKAQYISTVKFHR